MKVFVTGADGFIGSHLVETLVEHGYDVTAFCLYNSFGSSGWLDNIPKEKKKFVRVVLGDIRDSSSIKEGMKGCDIVFHLAGYKSVKESEIYPEDYIQNNIAGSINLLKLMIKYKIKNIIFSSSATVYGKQKTNIYSEKMKCSPINTYGITKKIIEDLIIRFNQKKKN